MGFSGGGILVLIAVLMWAAVLVPRLIQGHQERARLRQSRRLQRTMQRLAHVAQETAADRLIFSAREALNREKLQELKLQREAAQRDARLAHARAQRELAKLAAKQAAQLAKAQTRAAKLVSPVMRRFRKVLAVVAAGAVVAVTCGAGYTITTGLSGWFFAALATLLGATAGLFLLAPGRNQHAQEILQRQHRAAVGPRRAAPQTAVAAASSQAQPAPQQPDIAVAVARETAAQRRANAERQARRKLLAQVQQNTGTQHRVAVSGAAQALENQTQSILLRSAAAKQQPVTQQLPQKQAVREPQPVIADLPQQAATAAQCTAATQRGAVRQAPAAAPQRVATAPLTAAQAERQQLVARLRRMGDLKDLQVEAVDLDTVLRNRRSANS